MALSGSGGEKLSSQERSLETAAEGLTPGENFRLKIFASGSSACSFYAIRGPQRNPAKIFTCEKRRRQINLGRGPQFCQAGPGGLIPDSSLRGRNTEGPSGGQARRNRAG